METKDYRIIVANITWNPGGWRNLYINPKAGHTFARTHTGHESLNFAFNKPIDTEENIFGYVQWTHSPRKLADRAVMIFYSRDLQGIGKIVGIYSDVKIVEPIKRAKYPGFENDELLANITAKRSMSLLFPIPLDSEKYSPGKRLVPQVGYTYKDISFAEQILLDEINCLKQSGIRLDEYNKLKNIYFFITGKDINETENLDEKEQEELLEKERTKTREQLIAELKQVTPISSEKVEVHGKQYKRDNKTIADLKLVRPNACQICGKFILTKDGKHYIEAAHIVPKRDKGSEIPSNILLLCPNHHKEFDVGNTKISLHNTEEITFELNGTTYTIKLSLD